MRRPLPGPAGIEPGPRVRTFAALRHRDFRLFWIGLVVHLISGWMQQLAGPLLVYRLSSADERAFLLGLVGFIAAVPAFPLSLVAGPLIDRLPRRPLLLACQIGLLLPPIGVAVLIWSGQVQVWHIVVAELLRGTVLAFDQPAKQSAIVDMTGKEDVGSAIGLWSSASAVTRVLGPIMGSAVVAWAGEGLCFFLNGLSYLIVLATLLVIRLPNPERTGHRSLGGSLIDGLKYVVRQHLILSLASLVVVAGLFVQPFTTPNLLPVFALDVLGSGTMGLGVLTAAVGAGAMVGGLAAASVPSRWQQRFALVAGMALPLSAAAFAFSRSFVLSCALLVLVGALLMALEIAVNALILRHVEDEYRGRVVSLFMAAVMGAPRVGGLEAGWLAGRLGAPIAFGVGAAISFAYGLSVAAVAGVVRLRRRPRPPLQP